MRKRSHLRIIPRRKTQASHFYVVNTETGGILNRVTYSDKERDLDDIPTRERKRSELARSLLVGWLRNYDHSMQLDVEERVQ